MNWPCLHQSPRRELRVAREAVECGVPGTGALLRALPIMMVIKAVSGHVDEARPSWGTHGQSRPRAVRASILLNSYTLKRDLLIPATCAAAYIDHMDGIDARSCLQLPREWKSNRTAALLAHRVNQPGKESR